MLVLSRRPQQSLLIGHDVVVTVLEVNGDTVRIGITAPPEVDIHREEVYLDLKKSNTDSTAAPGAAAALTRRMRGRGQDGAAGAGSSGAPAPDESSASTGTTEGAGPDGAPGPIAAGTTTPDQS